VIAPASSAAVGDDGATPDTEVTEGVVVLVGGSRFVDVALAEVLDVRVLACVVRSAACVDGEWAPSVRVPGGSVESSATGPGWLVRDVVATVGSGTAGAAFEVPACCAEPVDGDGWPAFSVARFDDVVGLAERALLSFTSTR